MSGHKDKTSMKRERFLKLALMGSSGLALSGLTSCNDSSTVTGSDNDNNDDVDDNDNPESNKYKTAGIKLLDQLHNNYYQPEKGLYAQFFNTQTLKKSTQTSFLWPAAHMMIALRWGAMINKSKYKDKLASFVDALQWYRNGEAFGCIHNGQVFFDDNGLLGNTLMGIYVKLIQKQDVLDKSLKALEYNLKYRDEQWGLPQTKNKLGQGIFLVGAVSGLANNCAQYYTVSKDRTYLNIAKTYFDKLNDYDLKIKRPKTNLLIMGSTYSNGTWTRFKAGPRAGATCGVITLGTRLYKITGDTEYLTKSRTMADAVIKRWYQSNGSFKEVPFWGGAGAVSMLCEMHEVDTGSTKWYTTAKNIIDFLIDHGKDKRGFYPMDTGDGAPHWDEERSNSQPPQKVKLIAQACAAEAILRFAYLDLNR